MLTKTDDFKRRQFSFTNLIWCQITTTHQISTGVTGGPGTKPHLSRSIEDMTIYMSQQPIGQCIV